MTDKNSIFDILQVKKKSERGNLVSPEDVKKSFTRNISLRSISLSNKYKGGSINQGEQFKDYLVNKNLFSNYYIKNLLQH